jgi:hypothetical protein
MRVAFDVKGTLSGFDSKKVWKLFRALESKGCEIVIWSNMPTFARDLVEKHNLSNDYECKSMKLDVDEENWYDLAVEDDRSQTWLAARKFIFVGDIPETDDEIEELSRNLTEG